MSQNTNMLIKEKTKIFDQPEKLSMKISKEEKTKTLTTDKHKYDATNCDNFEAVFKGKSHESAMNLP